MRQDRTSAAGHGATSTIDLIRPATLLTTLALLGALLAGCSNPQGSTSTGGTTNQLLLDHSGGTDRHNAYN